MLTWNQSAAISRRAALGVLLTATTARRQPLHLLRLRPTNWLSSVLSFLSMFTGSWAEFVLPGWPSPRPRRFDPRSHGAC
jgi:hypothetical protein